MIRIYADAQGQVVAINFSDDPLGPAGLEDAASAILPFDHDVNPDLLSALFSAAGDWSAYTLIDNLLYHEGVLVTVNPPGEPYLDYEYLRTWWQQLTTALDNTDVALAQTEQAETVWPGLTPQEKQAWLVQHFDEVLGGLALVLRVAHGILRFIRWLIKQLNLDR